jgi:hypothetical protein
MTDSVGMSSIEKSKQQIQHPLFVGNVPMSKRQSCGLLACEWLLEVASLVNH